MEPGEDTNARTRRRLLALIGAGVGTVGVAGVGLAELRKAPTTTAQTPAARAQTSVTARPPSADAGSHAAPSTSPSPSASRSPKPLAGASAPTGFVHPGMLHTQADFDRMKAKVSAGAQPWTAGWDRLVANGHSQSTWKAKPLAIVIRGSGAQNYWVMFNDIHAAYQNALRWRISGDAAHGDAARDILNAWSGTLTKLEGGSDATLAAGIYGYQWANAAEIMRGYPGFDMDRFKHMLMTVFYPGNDGFLTTHWGRCIEHYWANWDLCNMASMLAIGIFCDDKAMFDRAIGYFQNGGGNGAIRHAVPFVYPGGLGQWQESGRDQGHATLGVGLAGAFCEMAWNQGQDMYGYDDSRLLKGAEYVAKYNLGQNVPYTTYTWLDGPWGCAPYSQKVISSGSRGDVRPIWELLYNHYVKRRGMPAPNVEAFAAKSRAEGGGGDYGPNSGGYDQLGFGTLTCTR